ncbi:MAG: hypothetical protein IT293_22160 [Deltaproteobacteria bacterium]|nr:hypothetical protein [Deltaproteobacteria bacterium]
MSTRPTRGELALAAALLALGAALRCWRLDLGWFGVDQARDVQTALDVAAGSGFPIVGPTMRRVTSLGALYHYVWALPHLASDEPLAAYRFAAGLGVATLVATWLCARRWWGARPALVALAVLATSRVAIIDGRVAWAPAALPPVALALVALLAGPATPARLALVGATLGLAVQLHLAMAAWVVAAAGLVLARRPTRAALAAGVMGGIATGFPAAYAALANAGRDAGLATLPSRGPPPDVLARLVAAWCLEWRVPEAFWQWPDAPAPAPLVARGLAVLVATAAGLGIGRAVLRARRGDRPAAVLAVVTACQLGMVVLLPGEAWYYYLDALLPLAALAAGLLVAGDARSTLGRAAAAVLIGASTLLGGWSADWLATIARHGYLALAPAALTLDGAGGRDAPVPGRLLTMGVKRELAALLADDGAAFPARWASVHGPAFDDATGDNGFWLARAAPPSGGARAPRHVVLWYRDDPGAPVVAPPRFELVDLGPLRVARYRPAVAYESCRGDDGAPVTVPIRVLPAPRRYGDGTIARPTSLPRRVTCEIDVPAGGVRVVASVGSGTVTVREDAGPSGSAGSASALCFANGPRRARVVVDASADAAGELDLYERPDPACDAGKIAP